MTLKRIFIFFLATFPVLGPLLTVGSGQAQNAAPGKVAGVVVDAESGDPLVGATVFFRDTNYGTMCDLDGNYLMDNVVPGTYVLEVSIIGYNRLTATGVLVEAGTTVKLDVSLQPEAIELDEEVVVEAEALRNTGAALLKDRQKAPAVSDAISAAEISRAGSGDAAEAMSHVTGASVVEGKYVYIRGLGDRYSTVQLNGASLPSSDPDRKTVPMDMFPANLLDNIVTTKSFTPDKPGNFTGGSINIGTKSFPENLTVSVSATTSFNAQSSLKDGFLTYDGGEWDWLGRDDGTRELPDLLADGEVEVPDVGSSYSDAEKARQLDRISKAFSPVMAPTTRNVPLNNSHSVALGNQMDVLNRPLGFLATFTYSRKFSSYDEGSSGRWQLSGHVDKTNTLTNNFQLNDARSSEEILWGGLLNFSCKLSPNHELSSTFMQNHNSDDVARILRGSFPRDLEPEAVYETRVLQFKERNIRSSQVQGKHHLKSLLDTRVEWSGSQTETSQDEPDLRFFTNDYTTRTRQGRQDTLYNIAPSIYPLPTRYFRNLDEFNRELQANIAVPLKLTRSTRGTFKFGGTYLQTGRSFRERRFEYDQDKIKYDGDPLTFFEGSNVGIIDSTGSRLIRFGNYVRDATQPSSNFDGDQRIYAGYAMVDLAFTRNLRAIFGGRLESTRIEVASLDSAKQAGELSNDDLLPSVSLVYSIRDNMNLRGSYGLTLARPTFRELAPYSSFDFVGAFTFTGNPDLKRTLIDNFDLRWEWFDRPGEIYAGSVFYKDFQNPIERAILTINGEVQFQNVEAARVMGIEFEARKSLEQLNPRMKFFFAGANLSLVDSEVSLPPSELEAKRAVDPDISGNRSLQGQSPYLLNVDLSYDNFENGTAAGFYYNLFGRRLAEVSLGGTPNVYELPRGSLDFTFAGNFNHAYRIKFSAKNLLNPDVRKVYPFKGIDYVAQEYTRGRSFSLGLTYEVNR